MHGDGSVIQKIATTAGHKTDPAISPDGRKIVFTVGDIDAGSASPLWVVSSDGTGLTQLTTDGRTTTGHRGRRTDRRSRS